MVMATEQVKEAAEVYIYGYPLVYDLQEVANFVSAEDKSLPIHAPYNAFAAARALIGPETKFVSPNNDTLYLIGQCDVRQGPVVLHVPDTHDRYYVLQFVATSCGSRASRQGVAAPRPKKPVSVRSRWTVSQSASRRLVAPSTAVRRGDFVVPSRRRVVHCPPCSTMHVTPGVVCTCADQRHEDRLHLVLGATRRQVRVPARQPCRGERDGPARVHAGEETLPHGDP
jgi:hypothetical protein